MKNSYLLQEIVKGFSNHYRIEILQLLQYKKNLSVEAVSWNIGANYKTISVHMRRMHRSGIISKQYRGKEVIHNITRRGEFVLTFLGKLE